MTEKTVRFRMLDLFSGLGGASAAMRDRGWEVVTVDIEPKFKPSIVADITTFHPPPGPWDLVWASPPCIEFSGLTVLSYSKGQRGPPDPEKGLILVKEAVRVIKEAEPRWWVVENVRGSTKHISKVLGPPSYINGAWVLWGRFPLLFGVDKHPLRKGIVTTGPRSNQSSAIRSIVHPHISRSLALAVEASE